MVKSKICLRIMQITTFVYFMISAIAQAKCPLKCLDRKPANFVPDEDVIIVPMVIEKNIMHRFHHKHGEKFKAAKKKIAQWQAQEDYAQAYGLEDAGFLSLPTAEEKEKFFHRNYLRFLSKDLEKSGNASLKESWESWTVDDEIDSIRAIEYREKVLVRAQKSRGKKQVKSEKTLKVGKDKIKFGLQVRPEIGMMKLTLKSKYFYARAWVGVNGNQELKVEKSFKSTNTRALVNYYIEQSRMIAAVDQGVVKNVTFRVSHSKIADGFSKVLDKGTYEDTVFSLRYGLNF